jgi:hypothetical protein
VYAHSLTSATTAARPAARRRSAWRLSTTSGVFGDLLVKIGIGLSLAAAPVLALADCLLRPARTIALWRAARRAGMRPVRELRRIWFARAAREALRILGEAGLQEAVLRRIVVRGNKDALDQPAVFAVYHTPWARLLASWMSADRRVVLLAGGLWASRAPGVHATSDLRGMRHLLAELRRGRSAAVTIDHFGERGRITCRSEVLGFPVEACTGTSRLAAHAGLPLVPVALRWHRGRLEIWLGRRLTVTAELPAAGIDAALSEFNAALRCDLSSWDNAHRFLSLRVGAAAAPQRTDCDYAIVVPSRTGRSG